MCDLIDLKSPEGKTISGTKLASPLIPAPSQDSKNDDIDSSDPSNASSGLNFIKRKSIDNNPFDNAHHKTVEYLRKQEDPFEKVLERALMYEDCKSKASGSKARAVEFNDDFTPKKRRYSDVLKMNKTLDASGVIAESNVIEETKKIHISTVDAIPSMFRETQKCDSVRDEELPLFNGRPIPHLSVDPAGLDSSILNQSAMNDSLTESSGGVDESLLKSIVDMRIRKKISSISVDPDLLLITNRVPKLLKHRRSLSQGDKMSPRKFREHRYHSIVDGLRIGHGNNDCSFASTAPSIVFEDSMNNAFLHALSTNSASVFSDLSNISSIARLTPLSSAVNSSDSSSAFSARTANCAFIESTASDGTSRKSREIFQGEIIGTRIFKSSGSTSSVIKSPMEGKREEKDLNDLILKYAKLRSQSSESAVSEVSTRTAGVTHETVAQNDESVCPKKEDKLIDVDFFIPQAEGSPDSFQRKSISSTSSDSVFADTDTIEKSIFSEAKTLAKTFEELASRTGSSSQSSDDLVNSRPNWNFDMLPPSDDEAPVDDLIELQKSPSKSDKSNGPEANEKSASSSDEKSERSFLKELDTKFRDPENKVTASALLLDLEKLVKSEANSEAAELLKSLEKALGIKCQSNVDLLATCLSVRNDLTKSPKRSEDHGGNENIKNENIEKSREDNNDVETSESFKRLNLSDDKNLENNINLDKVINKSDKSPILVSKNFDDLNADKARSSENSSEDFHNDSIDAIKQQNQLENDQKMAVEILVSLGKLLSGENTDPQMSTLLKNLSNALNLASSKNFDQDVDIKPSAKEAKRSGGTPVKNRVASPRKSPAFSRTANRRSFEFNKAKTTGERVTRRSISVSQTPPSTTSSFPRPPNTPLSVDKSKAHLKEGKKRFSSDPSSDLPSINGQKSNKEIILKPVVSELARQDKPSSTVIGSVKNRFRKKTEPDGASKKGPMKAILPLGNMQRRGSVAKKDSPLNGSVTPTKPSNGSSSGFAVTTSTPFPIVHLSVATKKSPKTKPMASSTPDDVGTKYLRRSTSHIPQSPRKNSFSCNISPVTSKINKNNDETPSQHNSTSSRTNKIGTPLKSRQSSQLPKLSPMLGMKTALSKSNRGQRRSEPIQSLLPKSFGTPKSPTRRIGSDGSTSPLNNSNKLGSTVKPLNLISKLGRRKPSVAEKENYV